MKKFFLVLSIVILTASATFAKGTDSTWTGTLVDKKCSGKAKHGDMINKERECVMRCAKNGKDLGVMISGMWYSFDPKGEKMAWKVIKNSKMDQGVDVVVTGTRKGKKIWVKTIVERL